MSHALGHRLRDGGFPAPSETRKTGVVIVGAGISGLAAAWKLAKSGVDDFLVLDAENEFGGNSRAGQSPLVALPCLLPAVLFWYHAAPPTPPPPIPTLI